MSKIIIFGFPYSGTSILKSIICHIDEIEEIVDEIVDEIEEIVDETMTIDKQTTKKYIL